jgi:flagellar hook-basal body complex protein FliE
MIPAIALVGSALGAASSSDAVAGAIPQSSVTALGTSSGADFGQVLMQVAGDTVGNLKTAEATSIAGLQGRASTQQVVESVSKAQDSLQMALAVRDKVVSAYQDITRMTI